MDAELIAVGSELLRFGRRDTNSEWLADRLARLGIEVRVRHLVDDAAARIAALVSGALGRADVVLLTGGLGPTDDDRTREALALALDAPLQRDETMVERLRERFRTAGFPFRESQARQADRPRGMRWMDNPLGSAPGLLVERDGRLLAALPGVPGEMRAMFEGHVAPALVGRAGRVLARRRLRVAGRTESSVDEALRDLYEAEGMEVTILSGAGVIELLLRAGGRDEAQAGARLAAVEAEIVARLGDDLFGRDDDTLAAVTGNLLRSAGRTLATAESCTAGLLAGAITAVPGSSAWYRGGVIAYGDDLKVALAGVSRESLARHGAVSAEVARELARGVRERCGADLGVGVTGIAGPGGGSVEKPVGLVFIALSDAGGEADWRLALPGARELIRRRAVNVALDRIRRWVSGAR